MGRGGSVSPQNGTIWRSKALRSCSDASRGPKGRFGGLSGIKNESPLKSKKIIYFSLLSKQKDVLNNSLNIYCCNGNSCCYETSSPYN